MPHGATRKPQSNRKVSLFKVCAWKIVSWLALQTSAIAERIADYEAVILSALLILRFSVSRKLNVGADTTYSREKVAE